MTEPLIQLVSWSETRCVTLSDEDANIIMHDPANAEAVVRRFASGRILEWTAGMVAGLMDLIITYRPIATAPCVDCVRECVTLPALATERLDDGTLLCGMHDHYRKMAARGRGLDFSSDSAYWRNWFQQMAPHSELAREVLASDLLPPR